MHSFSSCNRKKNFIQNIEKWPWMRPINYTVINKYHTKRSIWMLCFLAKRKNWTRAADQSIKLFLCPLRNLSKSEVLKPGTKKRLSLACDQMLNLHHESLAPKKDRCWHQSNSKADTINAMFNVNIKKTRTVLLRCS